MWKQIFHWIVVGWFVAQAVGISILLEMLTVGFPYLTLGALIFIGSVWILLERYPLVGQEIRNIIEVNTVQPIPPTVQFVRKQDKQLEQMNQKILHDKRVSYEIQQAARARMYR